MEIFTLGLMHELQEGEKVEVDEGYTGDIPIRPKSDFGGKQEWKHMKGKARARHEGVNRMFKQFGILGQKFRCVASKSVFMHMHCTLCSAIVQSRPSKFLDCIAHCSVQQFTSQQNVVLFRVHPTARRYEIMLICKPNLLRKVCNELFLLARKIVHAYLR